MKQYTMPNMNVTFFDANLYTDVISASAPSSTNPITEISWIEFLGQ